MTVQLLNKYDKILNESLDNYYSAVEIDEFAWHVDIEDEQTYRFNFIDHQGNHKHLVYDKATDETKLLDVN